MNPNVEKTLKTTGKVALAVTGIKAVGNGLRGAAWAVTGARRLKAHAATVLRGPQRTWPEFPDTAPSPADRFAWLAWQMGLEQGDIAAMQANAKVRFTWWAYAAILFIGYALAAPGLGLLGHSFLPVIDHLMPWVVAVAVLLQAVRWSYWHMQLRRREILPLSTWLRHPGEWLAPIDDRGGTHILSLLLAFGMAALFYPGMAMAADNTLDVIQTMAQGLGQGDLSLQWMQRLFPSVFTASGVSYPQDVTAQLVSTVNSMLMTCGGFLLCWHTVVGVVNTAHSGKVLGDGKWHQIWSPIRVVYGFAAVTPIQGYCLAQLIVIQILLGGFGLANTEWKQYVNLSTGAGGSAAVSVPPDASAQWGTLNNLLAAELCYQTALYQHIYLNNGSLPTLDQLNAMVKTGFSGGRPLYAYPPAGGTQSVNAVTWDYGQVCGRITWPIHQAASQTAQAIANGSAILNIPAANTTANNAAVTTFDQTRAQAFGTLVQAIRSLAVARYAAMSEAVVSGDTATAIPDMVGLVQQAQTDLATFKSSVLAASGTLSSTLNADARSNFQTRANALGWASAGALQPLIVRANATVIQRMSETPDMEAPKLVDTDDGTKAAFKKAMDALGKLQMTAEPPTTGQSIDYEMDLVKTANSDPTGILATMLNRASHAISSYIINSASLNVTDPVSDIQDQGQAITAIVVAVWWKPWMALTVAANAADGAAQGASNIPLVGGFVGTIAEGVTRALVGFINTMTPLWTTCNMWLLGIGAGLSVVLPMMQYTMWLFAILGMMTYCVEAVVGASFWAFAHIRMDGGADLIGPEQRHGYAICWNALFRPSLMVLGLIFGNVVLSVSTAFVNITYVIAADSNFADRFVDPISLVTMLAMLLYIHYQLVARSYALITQLPDRVARWSGAQGEGLGEEGHHETAHNTIVAGIQRGGQMLDPAANPRPKDPSQERMASVMDAMAKHFGVGTGGGGAGRTGRSSGQDAADMASAAQRADASSAERMTSETTEK